MSRVEKVNEQLKDDLAVIVNSDVYLDGGLITIIRVKCAPDMSNANVNISVLPENLSGTALKLLRKNASAFTRKLSLKSRMRKVPRLTFGIDNQERYVAKMDKVFAEIRMDEKNDLGKLWRDDGEKQEEIDKE
ncbi:ribosome-binding factor A [Candidatus Parcubacteria bacterium]|nr:ribosome-binding factor A [Patescibacteria group bacterium]MBU4309809.1 ribosome-binding factor A [Patescibacteria group bacterium]MBU4432205.1 ribosome-binding factor A [Patescibacteria group bacterium]MBU4578148.1 ribosome-binding factor A [Patescibacteria group bacterium]MCG2696685.1 ribosome-binding factor A [Candidatus Parcubacteria bacterium]